VIVPDTRSSASPTATLFDFVLNRIGECKSSLTTTPSTTLANNPVAPGTAVTDIAKFAGTTSGGSAPNPSSPPNVFFSICGPIPTTSTVLACDGSDAAHTAASVSNQPWVHCTGVATPSSFCTGADPQGTSEAQSSSVSKTAAGIYCFKATWAGDTNYPTGASDIGDTTTGTECYRVKDTSTTTTEQNWLPNDTAHVRNSSGGAASGSVVFTLYNNGTCNPGANNADVLATFPSTGSITLDASGDASTNNTTTYVAHQPGATVSWKVVYTPANSNDISGSTSSCESSVLTINNNPNSP
jgi:hypothetical protein